MTRTVNYLFIYFLITNGFQVDRKHWKLSRGREECIKHVNTQTQIYILTCQTKQCRKKNEQIDSEWATSSLSRVICPIICIICYMCYFHCDFQGLFAFGQSRIRSAKVCLGAVLTKALLVLSFYQRQAEKWSFPSCAQKQRFDFSAETVASHVKAVCSTWSLCTCSENIHWGKEM